jgi:hypothetical protein
LSKFKSENTKGERGNPFAFLFFSNGLKCSLPGRVVPAGPKKSSNKCGTFLPLDHHIHHKGS